MHPGGSAQALDFGLANGNNPRCRMPEKSSASNKRLTPKEARELDIKISFLEGLIRPPRAGYQNFLPRGANSP